MSQNPLIMKNPAKRALIFDLDGTLWNSVKQVAMAWNAAMAKEGEDYFFDEAGITRIMGLTPEETGPICFPGKTKAEQMRLFRSCFQEEIVFLTRHPGVLYPFEEDVLKVLKPKYDLYVLSNSDKGYVESYLKGSGLGSYFKGHLCAGDTGLPKGRNIRYLMEKEGIAEAIYIGDTLKDQLETTKIAEIPFIWAAYGFGRGVQARYSLRNLGDLPLVVEKVFADFEASHCK